MVQKVNPIWVPTRSSSFIGKTISFFDIDLNVDASASTAPDEVIDSVVKVLSNRATIVLISALTGSGQLLTVAYEGEFRDDDYNGDGTATSLAAQLQVDIRALGTIDSLALTGATVTAGVVYRAEDVTG